MKVCRCAWECTTSLLWQSRVVGVQVQPCTQLKLAVPMPL
jgi:hypothetical protein